MTRSELCVRVAAATSLSKADAAAAVGAVFSAIADALAKGETVAGRRVRELHHQGPRGTCRSQPSDRRSRRYRRLSSAGLQGREGPSRRGPRIASTPTSLDPRRLQRPCRRAPAVAHHGTTAPSAPTRGDTPALKFRCFLIACTRSIAGPVPTATGGSQSRLRPLLSGLSRCLDARAPGRLGQGEEGRISLNRPTVPTHAQPRAALELSRARAPYIAGCEFSAPTVLRIAAQAPYWTRYPAAYGPAVHEPKPLVRAPTKTSPTPTTGRRH